MDFFIALLFLIIFYILYYSIVQSLISQKLYLKIFLSNIKIFCSTNIIGGLVFVQYKITRRIRVIYSYIFSLSNYPSVFLPQRFCIFHYSLLLLFRGIFFSTLLKLYLLVFIILIAETNSLLLTIIYVIFSLLHYNPSFFAVFLNLRNMSLSFHCDSSNNNTLSAYSKTHFYCLKLY